MEIQAASRKDQALLGQGYDVFQEEFVGQCVVGRRRFAGLQEAKLRFDRSLDQQEMSRELGFDVGVKARYGLFSASLAAQFASSSSASDYSDVTIYSHIINLKNEIFEFEELTKQGKAAKGSEEGQFVFENWPLTCGHEFVSQIALGAKLLVSVTVTFATRREKMDFSANFRLQGPPGEVAASLKTASQRYGRRASLSIQAYQMGGKPERLSRIFGVAEGVAPPIITASLDDPKAVNDLLMKVVEYSRDDFPQQIDPNLPSDQPGGSAQVSYITKPWETLGFFSPPPVIEGGVKLARRNLSDAFERQAGYQQRLRQLLFGKMRLSRRQLDRFTEVQRVVQRNLSLIQETALIVYKDATKGPKEVEQTIGQLTDFSPEQFEVEPESFTQWFDIKDLPATKRETKEVLDGLVVKFRDRFNNFDAIEDKGQELQKLIENLDELALSNERDRKWFDGPLWSIMTDSKIKKLEIILPDSPLDRLRPLTSLQHLRIIGARNQDLTPIAVLRSLLTLHLVEDTIADVTPLASLTALRNLTIEQGDGRLADITPLSALTNLVALSLTAPITDLSPLARLSQLTSLQLQFGRFADLSALAGLGRLSDLRLVSDGIRDLSPLGGLRNLTSLAIASRSLVDAAPLRVLSVLRSLGLSARISDISPLASLLSLRSLSLSGCPFQDFAPILAIPQLVELDISVFTNARNDVTHVFDDVKALGTRREFSNLFVAEDRIAIAEGGVVEGVWSRRGRSSAFDAMWTDRRSGSVVRGSVAIENVDIKPENTRIRMKGRRGERAFLYVGRLTSDRREVTNGTVVGFDASGQPLPEGDAERSASWVAKAAT